MNTVAGPVLSAPFTSCRGGFCCAFHLLKLQSLLSVIKPLSCKRIFKNLKLACFDHQKRSKIYDFITVEIVIVAIVLSFPNYFVSVSFCNGGRLRISISGLFDQAQYIECIVEPKPYSASVQVDLRPLCVCLSRFQIRCP